MTFPPEDMCSGPEARACCVVVCASLSEAEVVRFGMKLSWCCKPLESQSLSLSTRSHLSQKLRKHCSKNCKRDTSIWKRKCTNKEEKRGKLESKGTNRVREAKNEQNRNAATY